MPNQRRKPEVKPVAISEQPFSHVINFLNTQAWAILPDYLDVIHGIVAHRVYEGKLSEEELKAKIGDDDDSPSGAYDVGTTRVVPIHGTIMKRMPLFSRISGGASTEVIRKDIRTGLDDPSVKSILLDIESPGGSVDGPFELSDYIYSVRGQKPIRAFANGLMASAAYFIGSAADEIMATQSAIVGSIGVITAHYDYSKYLEGAGVKVTYLTAGKYKAMPNDVTPLDKESTAYVQDRLDYLYTLFVNAVARNRGVAPKQVLKDMADGRIFVGGQAQTAGLVDRVATFEEAVIFDEENSFESISGRLSPADIKITDDSKTKEKGGLVMPITRQQIEEEAPELLAEIQEDAGGEGASRERTRVVEILEAGGDLKVATQAIKDGIKADAAFKLFFNAEKQKRVDALQDMAEGATGALGQGAPLVEKIEKDRRPDEILAERCQKIMAEKGVSYEEAQRQVLAADPKLKKDIRESLTPQ